MKVAGSRLNQMVIYFNVCKKKMGCASTNHEITEVHAHHN